MQMRFFPAAAFALLTAAAPCQVTSLEAPPQLLDGLQLNAGTVEDLALPLRADQPFRVEVRLGGRAYTLDLHPHDVRSKDFQLLVDDGQTIRRLPTPQSVTCRGTVLGDGSPVAATLVAGSLSATVHFAEETWGIQPANQVLPSLPASTHVVYRAADARKGDVSCGTQHDMDLNVGNNAGPGPQALKIAELAIDADLEYYQRNGSNTTNVNNAVTAVINGVNVIYERDVEIRHAITTILIRTSRVYTWSGDLCQLLGDFRSQWNANHGSIQRDVAQLFTGKGSFSGVVGCAYVSVICSSSAYGANKAYASLTTNIGLVAHEMGHNWGSGHCNSSPPCNIMCSGLGGCNGNLGAFGPFAISAISAHRNSRGCLDDPPPTNPPVITNIAPNSTTSWEPGTVTLTGTDLGAVTSVTVGGASASIGAQSDTSLTFTPPSPFDIATHPVVATNVVGSSNSVNLTITGNHPAEILLSAFWFRGISASVDLHSDTNWQSALFFSPSNSPSSAPGIIDLGIGGNFSSLIFGGNVTPGTDGAGFKSFFIPLAIPSGTTLYWQAASIDLGNPTLPIETSNVASRTVL